MVFDLGPDGIAENADDVQVGSDVTDENGDYLVEGLAPGDYYVKVETPEESPLSSTDIATTDDPNNDEDSDDNGFQPDGEGADVWSGVITLEGGEEPTDEPGSGGDQDDADDTNGNMTVDFGFLPELSLGSTVFADNNNNGIQDPEDDGIEGVTIMVFNLGPDGIAENDDDEQVGQDVTDAEGNYFVDGLAPGDYYVKLTPSDDFPGSSDPTSDDPNDNTDSDDNGLQPDGSGADVWSNVITLVGGEEPTDEPGEGGDQDAADDADGNMTLDFGFRPAVDVSLIKVVSDAEPNVGDVITFTVTVSNEGPNDATGISVEDNVPNGYSNIENVSGTGSAAGSVITWTGLDIAAGSSVDLTFDVTVEAPLEGVNFDNVAEVTTLDQADIDSEEGNGIDPDEDGLIGSEDDNPNDGSVDPDDDDDADNEPTTPQVADLSLIKTVSDATPNVGDVITFTIEVINDGPNDATNVAVADEVPNGYSAIENVSDGGSDAGTTITWEGLTVPADGSITLTFDVTVEAPLEGVEFDNVADVTASDQFDPDSDPGNGPDSDDDGLVGTEDDNPNDGSVDNDGDDDEDNEPTTPQVSDLSLIKLVSDATPNIGDVITFTIEVTNDGPSDATGVAVTDEVPNGYSNISAISDGGSDAGSTITWLDLSIASGATQTLTFDVVVEAPGDGVEFNNIASVTDADQFDPDSMPGNEPDSDDDGLIGSEDDNPNDPGIDPDDEDDADDEPVEPLLLSIGSNVFVDNDNDGIRDDDEPGIEGLLVEIFNTGDDGIAENADDELVGSDVTDENGDYFVDNLIPGDYYASISEVNEDFPASSTPTSLDPNDDTDNDDNGIQNEIGDGVWSNVITLSPEDEPTDEPGSGGDQDDDLDDNGNMTLDFGFAPLVSLGSTVFEDVNNNGLLDEDEGRIEGLTVEVFDLGPDGIAENADDQLVGSDVTDVNGNYFVDGLLPGDYYVSIAEVDDSLPISSTGESLDPNDDTDNDDNGIQNAPGEGVWSNVVTLTGDGEPTGEGAPGGNQDSEDDDNGNMTVDFGFFAPASIGDFVFEDVNFDGLQDDGDMPIEDVVVSLTDSLGNSVTDINGAAVAPTMTDATGFYQFTDLFPSDYIVVFEAPDGFEPTLENVNGEDDDEGTNDSDPGPDGQSDNVWLDSGEDEPDVDAGFFQPASIGDFVFEDVNFNGLQDDGDIPIEGVEVSLTDSLGNSVTDITGAAVVPTTTDETGFYQFTDLFPSDYIVVFEAPEGFEPTIENVNGDEDDEGADDSDPNADGAYRRCSCYAN